MQTSSNPSISLTPSLCNARFRLSTDVVHQELDGETILLNLVSGFYYQLDAVGARMLKLLMEQGTVSRTCVELSKVYRATAAQLESDLLELTRHMVDAGLAEWSAAQ